MAIPAVLACAWGCSRTKPDRPDVSAVPPPDPERATRAALFGTEALAADIRWNQNGLGYRIVRPGAASRPGIGASVRLAYTGRLKDGTVFDHPQKPAEFFIGGTIPGLSAGLQLLGTGGKATFYIPPALGYGPRKVAGIPPNSGLIFDVEIVEIGQ